MKIILLDVMSLDGKLTKWNDSPASDWASAEDSTVFLNTVRQSKLVVMGSTTFLVNKIHPHKERLCVVMTRRPEAYKSFVVQGQLEFTNEQPGTLITHLEDRGYSEMLLISGSKIATLFFQQGLIDELWVTIEPRVFGKGLPIVGNKKLDIQLTLFEMTQLNTQGTIQLKYHIIQ